MNKSSLFKFNIPRIYDQLLLEVKKKVIIRIKGYTLKSTTNAPNKFPETHRISIINGLKYHQTKII